jgi:hypothetical protein
MYIPKIVVADQNRAGAVDAKTTGEYGDLNSDDGRVV